MQTLRKLSLFLVKVEEFIVKWTMTAVCLVILFQILGRNLGFPAGWTGEVALLCSTWMTYMGGALAVQKKSHFSVDLFPGKTGPLFRVMGAVSTLTVAFFVFYLVWQGFYMTWLVRLRVSGIADISMAWYFVSLPLSGLFMLVHMLDEVLNPAKTEE
jgi:TRAP-type C4-dicarboxylate transport system permease small subunit